MKKMFRIESVLTASSGIMLEDDTDGCIQVMSHVLNQELMTHQLPDAFHIVQPALEAQYPWLANVEFTGGEDNREKIERKINLLKRRFGDELEVASVEEAIRLPFTAGLERLGRGV